METPWLGRVTKEKRFIPSDGDILLCDKRPLTNILGRKFILPEDKEMNRDSAVYVSREDAGRLNEGDIISITEDGDIQLSIFADPIIPWSG